MALDLEKLKEAALAAQPRVILELIAEIERLRKERPGPNRAIIDALMYQHTGINERQFPDEYQDLKKFADALIVETA